MSNYARVINGEVVNVEVWPDDVTPPAKDGAALIVSAPPEVHIGYTFAAGVFTPPPEHDETVSQ